jgi:hypothetical protein
MRRKFFWFFWGILTVAAIGAIWYYQPMIGADTTGANCNQSATLDLVVITVNTQDATASNLTAYNTDGEAMFSSQAALGEATLPNLYDPSRMGNGGTPLGVYTMGKVWASSQGATINGQSIPYHPNVGVISSAIGPYFIDLSGTPVEGGDALTGLEGDGRHIGIHSRDNFQYYGTNGCARVPTNIVEALVTAGHEGKKVIITDAVVSGSVSPVDPESYDPTFENYAKQSKSGFSGSVDVTPAGTIHKYQRSNSLFWIAEVAKPSGTYSATGSAAGYGENGDYMAFNRNADGSLASSVGNLSVILPITPADTMESRYYYSDMYPNGYEGQRNLRVSGYDTTFMTADLGLYGSTSLTIPIKDVSPNCKPSLTSDALYVPEYCKSGGLINFNVNLVATPWHDLGYGHYSRAPEQGRKIGSFSVSIVDAPSSVTVPLSIGDADRASIKQWGVAISLAGVSGSMIYSPLLNPFIVIPEQHSNMIVTAPAGPDTNSTGNESNVPTNGETGNVVTPPTATVPEAPSTPAVPVSPTANAVVPTPAPAPTPTLATPAVMSVAPAPVIDPDDTLYQRQLAKLTERQAGYQASYNTATTRRQKLSFKRQIGTSTSQIRSLTSTKRQLDLTKQASTSADQAVATSLQQISSAQSAYDSLLAAGNKKAAAKYKTARNRAQTALRRAKSKAALQRNRVITYRSKLARY